MERLGRDVRAELGRLAPPDAGLVERLAAAWGEVAGPTAARNSVPQRVSADGTLHVATSSSTWAYELGRAAAPLLEELRARLGETAPRALRFAPGRLPSGPPPEETGPAEITPSDRRDAAELVAGVVDEELRDLLAKSAAASLARARSDRGF